MIILNMKIDNKKICKALFAIMMGIILLLIVAGAWNMFNINTNKVTDNLTIKDVKEIDSINYTNVLKQVHENLNKYVGKNIRFTGFIYRLYDFPQDKFVLARNMIVSSDYQAVIVGFLCHLNGAEKYEDGCWVEVEGTITKGEYHGEIPIIEITNIKQTKVPNDEYVYPPSDEYIVTDSL